MKLLKITLLTAFLIGTFSSTKSYALTNADSINVMVEASLFFEAYKNKQYEMWTIEKGMNVVNNKPDFMPKYEVYKKIDKVVLAVYSDSSVSEEEKVIVADTALHLYDLAIEYDKEDAGYFMLKKAYVLEKWKNVETEEAIAAYEAGFAVDTVYTADEIYYADQLGQLYKDNMSDENDYFIKAVDIYSNLADLEPENGRWIAMLESLVGDDPDKLLDVYQQRWYADKQNAEKAWKYAKVCKKAGDYEASIEPLQFLVDSNPDVINYWNEIARAYQKSDQVDMAIDSYKKLINLQPDNRDSYYNLALLYKDLDQLSASRSYLYKASKVSPGWDAPVYVEASLYEQAARSCGFDFEDKVVYQLAVDTYKKAARLGGDYSSRASERAQALSNSVPTNEDYFFRKMKNGETIKIEGKCYDWIGKSIKVSM